jgi:UrcA family protein
MSNCNHQIRKGAAWIKKLAVPFAVPVALLISFTQVAAAAEPGARTLERTVRYGDLNLAQPTDVAVLYSRIKRASREVCPEDLQTLEARSAAKRCRDLALSRAVADVNTDALTDYYHSRGGLLRP